MANKNENEGEGLLKGVFLVYFILILHVLLIAGIGCLVLFFRGVVQYMMWIFLGCTIVAIASGYYFFRRVKQGRKGVGEVLNSSQFKGRTVEVSLLGGLASFKLGTPGNTPELGSGSFQQHQQLEDPATVRIRELNNLADLLEKKLITIEEFNETKKQLFGF